MQRNIVVIGASAGGIEALRTIMAGLPSDFPATVLVVLHLPSYGNSVLPAILGRAGRLPATHPVSGEALRPGRVLVAPADHHLVIEGGRAVLTRGPSENGHRPAIDVLFRSAARAAGPRVVAVVLSGVLDDGTAGLSAVMARGGTSIVQDPKDALYSAMPENALAHVAVDHVLPAERIAPLLVELCAADNPSADPVDPLDPPAFLDIDAEVPGLSGTAIDVAGRPGTPSGFSCPDCGGVLWEIHDFDLVRYRCRVGHAWSAESLLGQQATQLDSALWMALRGLEEKAALARTLADRANERHSPLSAKRFVEQAGEASRAAKLIRSMLEAGVGIPHVEPETTRME
ncbi:MAG TPA: chemotaxis protein CheB [Jatrophihabitans sp.]|nr:chemotaxis protein CheB [Jatrophihabitans sp.]